MHNLVKSTYSVMSAIEEYSGHYDHFHILGVYSLAHLAVFIRIAKYCRDQGYNVMITSDSSTHIQSAVNKTYHTHLGLEYAPKRMIIGDKTRMPTVYSQFGCQCPVCRAIKYEDVLSVLDNANMSFLLASHNAFEMARYVQQLTDLCNSLSDEEYRRLVVSHMKGERAEYLQQALEMISDIEQNGFTETVLKKYRFFIPTMNTNYKELPPMFSDSVESDGVVAVDFEESRSHISEVLDRFEAFHSSPEEKERITSLHGKKTAEAQKNTRVNKGGAFIAKGGLAAQKKAMQRNEDKDKPNGNQIAPKHPNAAEPAAQPPGSK